jgi:hypothetical protein
MEMLVKELMAIWVVASFYFTAAASLGLPFPFGLAVGDLFTGPNNDEVSGIVALPQPMTFLGTARVTSLVQSTDGNLALLQDGPEVGGFVLAYATNIDTRNGGEGQNELWLRAANRTSDLIVAKDIIAGTGTNFSPQAAIVATWFKVEAFEQRAGPQNTFQLAMAYNAAGETWAILAYSQLEYFRNEIDTATFVMVQNALGELAISIAEINSTASMNALLNGTNCNRTGTYVFAVNAAPTKAPTQAPTKLPTKAPTNAPVAVPAPTIAPARATTCGLFRRGIFCPFTLCGFFGRWVGWCPTST